MKKIFRMAVVCALAGATLLYTGCTKDYSDDINDLKDRVSTLESTISAIQAQVGAGYYITNVQDVDGGFKVTLSNGKDYTITNGKDGQNGKDGKDGNDGKDGKNGSNGTNGEDGAPGQNGKDGSVVTIDKTTGNWLIDGKDTGVKAVATVDSITLDKDGNICINGKSTGVKAGMVAVWDQTTGTVTFKGINADGSDLVIGVCELESIVAIPQYYLEGIEGFSYNYLYGNYNSTVAYKGAAVTDDEKASATPVATGKHAWEVKGGVYTLGETATAEYHVNPDSFDITAADFALAGYTKEYITRAGGSNWSVVLDTISRDAKTKYAQVKYHITNPHQVTESVEGGKVGVMNLTGTVKNGGKAVASDYVAIIPFRQQLHHLAFQDQLTYVTNYDTKYASATAAYPCDPSTSATGKCKLPSTYNTNKELYTATVQAIQEIPSVNVNYRQTLDINTILAVHYHPSDNKVHGVKDAELTMNLADFLAKYPELKASYEVVPYTLGDTNTREDMYAQMDGSVFYPCWVEADEKTQHRNLDNYDGYDGHSSINRKPIILATVSDASGKVVLYGYFKIKIVEEVVIPTPTTEGYLIKNLGNFPYVCAYTAKTTWGDCSHTVLEQMHITYADFINNYVSATSPDGNTYIKKDGKFVDVTPDATHYYYGEFKYTQATTGTGVNDVYAIDVTSNEQLKNVNKDFNGNVTLYGKFTHKNNGNVIYLGLEYTVAAPATAKFIEHNSTYWKIAKNEETDNLLVINPIVPNSEYKTGNFAYGDVTNYSFWIDKSWTPNRVQMSLDDASKAVYSTIWNSSDKYYHYEFNDNQPTINNKKLVVKHGTNEDYIYLGTESADNLLVTINTQNVRKNSLVPDSKNTNVGEDLEGASTAVVDRKYGRITYACNKVSQDVLNTYPHPTFSSTNALEDDELKSMLYFNVDLVATYSNSTSGTLCEIPLGTETFHVAFFRPVDLKQGNPDAVKDALPLGDKICVGDLFYAEDWQNYKIIVKNAKTGKYEAGYFQNVVNWFDFYQFSKLNVGIKTIKTNQNDLTTPKYIFDQADGTEGVNNAALAQLVLKKYTAADTFTYEVIDNGVIDFTTAVTTEDGTTTVTGADVLNYYFINYSNYEGVAANFKLYVPVEVEYSWGKVTKEIEVPVTGTGL